MYGHVTKYRADIGVGVIAAEDGRTYRFRRDAVLTPAQDLVGEEVDFLVERQRSLAIVVTSASPWTALGPGGRA